MKVRIGRSESGLTIPLPQSLVDDLRLREGEDVEVESVAGRLIVRTQPPTLEELLEGVTPENLHGEFDWGPAVGKEVW